MGNLPLLTVVGETASGKSGLAMSIAHIHNGEIIAADSRTIYRGLDIGTAKPNREDIKKVPHHLLDIRNPDEVYTAGQFKEDALEAIVNIQSRGKLPIIVGGTGLYVNSILFDYKFGSAPNTNIRRKLEALSDEDLRASALELDSFLDSQTLSNRRHLIRIIENNGVVQEQNTLRECTLVIGLHINRNTLRKQIEKRTELMFKAGLRKEIDELLATYSWDSEGLTGIGYREFRDYYEGDISMSTVKKNIVKNTLKYAKRQRTWFKRNPHIQWFEDEVTAETAVNKFLQS